MARERAVLTMLIVLLLVLWAGFIVHRSPRFPGSLSGGVLAISGAVLMVVFSLAYVAFKRIPGVRRKISTRVSMGAVLSWHVYTSVVGAILALLHTGHRFESDLGVALTVFMLITVLSGYVGRHLLGHVALELREKKAQLATLETAYNEAVGEVARVPGPLVMAAGSRGVLARMALRYAIPRAGYEQRPDGTAFRAVREAQAIAELEYSITSHERFKRLAARWLKVHIAAALIFYALLGLHIWAAIHFGLRWFQ